MLYFIIPSHNYKVGWFAICFATVELYKEAEDRVLSCSTEIRT